MAPWTRFGSLLWLAGVFICSGGMLLGSMRLSWQGFWLFMAGSFLLIGALTGFYIILATLVNKATVTVISSALTIRHSPLPLPPWQTFSLDTSQIKQLYVDEKINSGQGSVAYHYRLYLVTTEGKSIDLFPFPGLNFNEWDKILYLEQEIERYLNLPDEALPQEPISISLDSLNKEARSVWRNLAGRHTLDFVERNPLKGTYLSGLYRGSIIWSWIQYPTNAAMTMKFIPGFC